VETIIKPIPKYLIHGVANGFLVEVTANSNRSAYWYVFLKWEDVVNYLKTGVPKNSPDETATK